MKLKAKKPVIKYTLTMSESERSWLKYALTSPLNAETSIDRTIRNKFLKSLSDVLSDVGEDL